MPLTAGARLGPYEIVSPLGAGGMGEVYRARDTRLHREVAVKVLPSTFVPSEETRQRFEREARLISQLSHPGICVLHDLGTEGDIAFLVMELLEGETLQERLLRGALRTDQVLSIGMRIASALDAAHAKGIVHRDLKPGNVMLTESGVKLVDFGLAKALSKERDSTITQMPTQIDDETAEGVLLGTVQYMSPEQLEGRPADARSDLFALGMILYEMATGRRAFTGTSRASLISSILTANPPPISSIEPLSPQPLDRLVRTCLAKDPADRWRSAHDVGLQLQSIAEASPTSAATTLPVVVPRSRSRWLPWTVAGVSLVVAALAVPALLGGLGGRSSTPQRPSVVRFTIAPPSGGRFHYWVEGAFLAIAPDGSRIAYVASDPKGGRRIWIRELSELEPRSLPGTEATTSSVFFSPDGKTIAFFSGGSLKRIDVAGGSPITICSAPMGSGKQGTWGPQGDILFGGVEMDAIYRVSAAGGTPAPVVKLDPARQEIRIRFPCFLSDGQRFLYLVWRKDATASLMLFEPGKGPRAVTALTSRFELADPETLVYASEGALLGQRFDQKSGRVHGAPFSIAQRVRFFPSTGGAAFAASRNGTVAFQPDEDVRRLVWFDRAGKELGTLGAPGAYLNASLAPSGRRLVVDRLQPDAGTYDVLGLDIEKGTESRLTAGPESEFGALLLPGEKSIVYSAARSGPPQLFRRDLSTGKDESPYPAGGFQQAQDLSPDGSTLVYLERSASGRNDMWSVPVAGAAKARSVVQSEFDKWGARFSPDGRHLAFVSDESGRSEVYTVPFPGPGESTRVSANGGRAPQWTSDGKEILFLSADNQVMTVPVKGTAPAEFGVPAPLFRMPGKPWGGFVLSPDGKRLLAIEPQIVGDEQPLTVVVNGTAN